MIGKTNAGGGSALNISVIAAASFGDLPSVASDNTIAVITSTAINGYAFSTDRQAGRPNGEVRITTAGRAVNACEISSDPLISVYPVSVYQTNGTTWTLMEAYLRKSKTWKRIRTYFYQAGVLGLITSLVGSNTGHGSYTIGADYFQVSLGTGGTSGFAKVCAGQTIEISEITTLKIKYTRTKSGTQGSHKARIILSSTQLTSMGTGVAYVDVPDSADGLASIDVSSLTGLVYIHAAISKSSYYESDFIRVTEIWGE